MLSHRSLCIGLLLFPALPAFGQTIGLAHPRAQAHTPRTSASVASPQVRAVILPIDGLESDSAEAIITRDLGFGDRVQIVSSDKTPAATAVVKAVATAQGVTVSLIDPLSGAVR